MSHQGRKAAASQLQSKGLAWFGAVGHTHIRLHSLETTILAADELLILSDWGRVCAGGQHIHGWVCMACTAKPHTPGQS